MALPKWLLDKIAYLRKSRQDDSNETVEEVLAKHETMLQEYCEREFGGRIPEENIYREVVSGESIADRTEVQKVLARIEDPAITGVVVIEPSRLSRGDLTDCGKLITALRFSKTLVHTPMMTYNLENKMERKFFQDELLRGNDFLEYTKDILWRGRVAAVKRGCFINHTAPYGYNKVKKGKDLTLEPNENADVVRMIFDFYVNAQLSPHQIARKLTAMKVPAPGGDGPWYKESVRGMLKNRHYIGLVFYNQQKTVQALENGELTKKRLYAPEEEVIVAKGKHPAIIDQELWDRAQARHSKPRARDEYNLVNPLATMLVCSKCGKSMRYSPYEHADDRYTCLKRPHCYKSAKVQEVMAALIFALEESELPALRLKAKNGDGSARKIQERMVAKLEKEMEEFRAQEDEQYDLLERKKYTQELFDRRNAALRKKMDKCQEALKEAKKNLPQSINLEERIISLENAIAALKDDEMPAAEKNKILKVILDRAEYTGIPPGTGGRGKSPFTLEIFLKI